MDESLARSPSSAATVAEQARKVRALYPELFAALDGRDQQMQRALRRLAHPNDPESWMPWPAREQALLSLWSLGAGIRDLCQAER